MNYWLKQALKHERTAATLEAKYAQTGERRWLRQAQTNRQTAACIRQTLKGHS